ncbi:TJAP1 protein, partial [Amia calva]|nr:TJAP1 protein [Amia calva]
MTSAAPVRKPYRKAPPQHREVRHDLPVFRDDLGATMGLPQPEPCQVTRLHNIAPVFQRTRFGDPPPKRTDSSDLLNTYSSSWSLASESEKEVSSLSSMDLTILPPPKIFSCSEIIATNTQGISRFRSRSEDLLVVSGDEDPTAEALSKRQARYMTTLPPKSILKQPNTLGVQKDNLRKSKSAELLGQNSHKVKPQNLSLDWGNRAQVQVKTTVTGQSATTPASPTSLAPEWKVQLLEEKLKFSEFLNEITYRILSPANLQWLGGQQPEVLKQRGSQQRSPAAAPCAYQRTELKENTDQKPEKSPRASRSADVRRPVGKDTPERTRRMKDNGPRPGHLPATLRRNVQDAHPEPEQRRTTVHREGARPKAEWPESKDYLELDPLGYEHSVPLPDGDPKAVSETLSDTDRIKILQQQNEDLRRRLTYTTHKMEAMESELESSRHFMQAELGRSKDDLEKMKDKFRRLQNSYTASQRANQDLEEKLHALILGAFAILLLEGFGVFVFFLTFSFSQQLRKVERDKKTMDQEIVELTNKLLDAKNTIDKLEELNERYRQDCNLAVQLLKCNKSHFRNHKFADLPYELQDMVNKHLKTSLPDSPCAQQDSAQSLSPADVVPTAVIARVLEKPEPLVLNSAQSSSSAGRPVAEDVFVHVDMTGPQAEGAGPGRENGGGGAAAQPGTQQHNGTHPLYPGRKVIEFSTDDKVKIPKNSPLPNCTYATRQAISLSLVQSEEEGSDRQRTVPNSPAVSEGGWRSGASSSSGGRAHGLPPPDVGDLLSTQSSPFSSPPQAPSDFASSGSSEEDLLANWQRMFVEKVAPASEGTLVHRTSFSSETVGDLQRSRTGKTPAGRGLGRGEQHGAYSDGEESSPQSWTASRESSLDTDNSSAESRVRKGHYGSDFSQEESEKLLMALDVQDDGGSCDTTIAVAATSATISATASPAVKRKEFVDVGSAGSSMEERDVLPQDFPIITPRVLAGLEDFVEKPPSLHQTGTSTSSTRPQKSPKRMGVHHLHRKDSLTRAQEHGNLLD